MFSRIRARRTADAPTEGPHCSMCGTPTTVEADGRCPLGHQVEQPRPEHPEPTAATGSAAQLDPFDGDDADEPVAEVPPMPVAAPDRAAVAEAQPEPEPAPVVEAPPAPEPEPEPQPQPEPQPEPLPAAVQIDEPEQIDEPMPAPAAVHVSAPDAGPEMADDEDDDDAALHTSSFFDDWAAPEPEDATLPESILDLSVADDRDAVVATADEDVARPAAETEAATETEAASDDQTDDGENVAEARERLLQAAAWFSAQDE